MVNAEEVLKEFQAGRCSTQDAIEFFEKRKRAAPEFPLSVGQAGLWLLSASDSSAYNVPLSVRIRERIDRAALEQACASLLQHFPILTARIVGEPEAPRHQLQRAVRAPLLHENVAALPASAVDRRVREHTRAPFDLGAGPLIRFALYEHAADDFRLDIVVHHLVFDGGSVRPLLETLYRSYASLKGGRALPPSQRCNYDKFVAWEAEFLDSPAAERQLHYWRKRLADSPPQLRLWLERPAAPDEPAEGGTRTTRLTANLSDRIRVFCRHSRVSLPAFFLGAYQLLLSRHSGTGDIVVGMPSSVRPRAEFDDAVGYFVNMIAVRSVVDGAQTCAAFLQQLTARLADDLDNDAYPFARLVGRLGVPRTADAQPLFQVAFTYQNATMLGRPQAQAAGTWTLQDGVHQQGQFKLELEIRESGSTFALNLKYDGRRFDAASIETIARQLHDLLEAFVERSPLALGRIAGISRSDRALIEQWNRSSSAYPSDAGLAALFEAQVRARPRSRAVICGEHQLTYAQLDARADEVANRLRVARVMRGELVGVSAARSLDMVAAVLGIIKAGAAYVPIDPSYPGERIDHMLADAKVRIVLAQQASAQRFAGKCEQLIRLDDRSEFTAERLATASESPERAGPRDLAYVIYTSGSTGRPKGVEVEQRSVARLVCNTNFVTLGTRTVTLVHSSMTFDAATFELWAPLLNGGCAVVLDGAAGDLDRMGELIAQHGVNTLWLTAPMLPMWIEHFERLPALDYLLVGGDVVSPELVARVYAADAKVRVVNGYGPTENTTFSCCYEIPREHAPDRPVPIGPPINQTQAYIVDQHLELLPAGCAGELLVGGHGVARGYRNNARLTEEKFIEDRFGGVPNERLYRTGDLAYWLPDGRIQFLGRADQQVKIRGFRVELGEVEVALQQHGAVKECAVLASGDAGHKQLIAYVVLRSSAAYDRNTLQTHLRSALPEYLCPSDILFVDSIPLNSSGKVDRAALLAKTAISSPAAPTPPASHDSAPTLTNAQVEERVGAIWRAVLRRADIEPDAAFFEIGGDSLLAMSVVSRIQRELAAEFRVTDLFRCATIRNTVAHIAKSLRDDVRASVTSTERPTPRASERQDFDATRAPAYLKDSVAIIGMSCKFPGASDHRQFWANLSEAKESIRVLPPEELRTLGIPEDLIASPSYVAAQSVVAGKDLFDAEFFSVSPRDAQLMDPQARALLEHSWKAIEDAGYTRQAIPETGVFVSTGTSGYAPLAAEYAARVADPRQRYSHWALSQSGSIPALISHKLRLKGPSLFVHTNCSSGLVVLDCARRALLSGEAELALAGAATFMCGPHVGYIHQEGAPFSADGHVRPFDAAASGMVGGEGVAVLLLKPALRAIADGDHIYALIRGIAVNNDGADKAGFYAPSVQGQVRVVTKALETAGVDAATIGYVEAHGTGTSLGDPIELAALNEVYCARSAARHSCGIGSVKSNIGHLDTAAALAGCIKLALSLERGEIPRTLHFSAPNPAFDMESSPFFVVDAHRRWEARADGPRRGALSSFGIGGTNAHAILEEYVPAPSQPDRSSEDCGTRLVPLSARSQERLKVYASELAQFLREPGASSLSLRDVAFTLQVGREPMPARAIFAVDSIAALASSLAAFAADAHVDDCWHGTDGAPAGEPPLLDEEETRQLVAKWSDQRRWAQIARLWISGHSIPWICVHEDPRQHRVSLPTYPFAPQRHWVTVPETAPRVAEQLVVRSAPVATQPAAQRQIPDLPPTARLEDKVTACLARYVVEILDVDPASIEMDTQFGDFGFDSISLASFSSRLNAAFDLTLSPATLLDCPTLRELVTHLCATHPEHFERLEAIGAASTAAPVAGADFLDGWQLPVAPAEVMPEALVAQGAPFETLLTRLLLVQLRAAGLLAELQPGTAHSPGAARIRPSYARWVDESRRRLLEAGFIDRSGESSPAVERVSLQDDVVWRDWNDAKARAKDQLGIQDQFEVVERALRELGKILTGERLAAEVLFSDGSLQSVESLYKRSPVLAYFNGVVADLVERRVATLLRDDPQKRVRILEIGAGTGATSAVVLPRLSAFKDRIAEYCYTDVSKAFLQHAKRSYAPAHPFLQTRLYNAEKSPREQGIDVEAYDVVLAANVLHATQNIRNTVSNARAMLKDDGMLLLNEMTITPLFSHLTFGLLDGWWLYEDEELRVPGSPCVSPSGWAQALERSGFAAVRFPARSMHDSGIQIVVAEAGPLVAQPTAAPSASVVPVSAESGHTRTSIVQLRRGDNAVAPLFLAHGIDGEVLHYLRLSALMPAGVPVYGLLPDRDDARSISMIELASRHVATLRRVQPHGPYRVAGFSFGGTLAYEIASQLYDSGEAVEFLGLIDADMPASADAAESELREHTYRETESLSKYIVGLAKAASNPRTSGAKLARLGIGDPPERVLSQCIEGGLLPSHYDVQGLERQRKLFRSFIKTYGDYAPRERHSPLIATVYRSKEIVARKRSEMLGWESVSNAAWRFIDIGDTHAEVLHPPLVDVLAESISHALGARGDQRQAQRECVG